jgi:phage shock protein A
MKSSLSQTSAESLSSKLDQIEERISDLEDKIDVLKHTDENKERKIKV